MKIGKIESIHPTTDRKRPRKDLIPHRKELLPLRDVEVPRPKDEEDRALISKEAREKFLKRQEENEGKNLG